MHAYYTFMSTMDYQFLFNYLQLRHNTGKRDHPVHIMPKRTQGDRT